MSDSQNPPLLTTAVIGLGAFGISVLNQLGYELRQGYGESAFDHVALIGLDFPDASQAGMDQAVSYYSLYSDPSDWLTKKSETGSLPHLKAWYDAEFYGGHAPLQAESIPDRQLARLTFLRHFVHDGSRMLGFFARQFDSIGLNAPRQSIRTGGSNSTPEKRNVYVLGSYTDMAMSALLLDVANLVRHSLRTRNEDAFVTVYLALPTATATIPTDREAATRANTYAALRELRRHSTGGDSFPELYPFYPHGSGLEQFNTGNRLVNVIRLFTDHAVSNAAGSGLANTPEVELKATWTSALLALLSGNYGKSVMESLANRNALELAANQNSGSATLHIGSHSARSVLFPLQWVRETWAVWLAQESFVKWSRPALSTQESSALLQSWARQDTFQYPLDGTDRSAPRILGWFLNTAARSGVTAVGDLAVSDIENRLSDAGFPQTTIIQESNNFLRRTQIVELAKQREKAVPAPEFIRNTMNILGRFVGGPTPTDTTPTYQQHISGLIDTQQTQFVESLVAFTDKMLQRGGARVTLTTLQTLVQSLNSSQQTLRSVLDLKRNSMITLTALFADSATRVGTLFSGWKESAAFSNFLGNLDSYVQQRKFVLLLAALVEAGDQFLAAVQRMAEQINAWSAAVIEETSALAECAQQASQITSAQINEVALDGRTLLDQVWIENGYQERIAPKAATLKSAWEWRFKLTNSGVQLHLSLADSPVQQADDQSRTYQRWLNLAQNAVAELTANDTLWTYLLSDSAAVDRFNIVESILTGSTSWITFHGGTVINSAHAHSHHLLHPPNETENQARRLIDTLTASIEQAIHANPIAVPVDGQAHLIQLSSVDMIKLDSINEYIRAESAYLNSSTRSRERERLSVLPGEAQAARLEALIFQYEKERYLFPPEIAALFSEPDRFELFVRAEAAGLIRPIPTSDGQTAMGVRLPAIGSAKEQLWWLTRGGDAKNIMTAMLRFTRNQPLGYGMRSDQVVPIRYDDIDAALTQVSERRAAELDELTTLPSTEEPWIYLELLQRQKKTHLISPMLAEFETLTTYHERSVGRLRQLTTGETIERGLLMATSIIAKHHYETLQTSIRNITLLNT